MLPAQGYILPVGRIRVRGGAEGEGGAGGPGPHPRGQTGQQLLKIDIRPGRSALLVQFSLKQKFSFRIPVASQTKNLILKAFSYNIIHKYGQCVPKVGRIIFYLRQEKIKSSRSYLLRCRTHNIQAHKKQVSLIHYQCTMRPTALYITIQEFAYYVKRGRGGGGEKRY